MTFIVFVMGSPKRGRMSGATQPRTSEMDLLQLTEDV